MGKVLVMTLWCTATCYSLRVPTMSVMRRPAPSRFLQPRATAGAAEETSLVGEMQAGVVVGLSSLPSSMAFANIAGLNPLVGIWSSVVLGATSACVGGCPGLIAGAAGVVVVPLAAVVTRDRALVLPTMLAAAALTGACSLGKAGALVRRVNENVLKGFLNGLGLLIFQSQLGVLRSTHAILAAASALAFSSLAPKVTDAPPALVGVVAATALSKVLKWPLQTLSDVYGADAFRGGLSVLPKPLAVSHFGASLRALKQPGALQLLSATALSIAIISVLETLLAAKVVGDEKEVDNDRLLAGTALGVAASACLGGFGGCCLIPQSVLNRQSGGRTRASAFAYAAFMAGSVVAAAPLIGAIPTAVLAGLMVSVSASTVQPAHTLQVLKDTPKKPFRTAALLAASVICYKVDMAAGIIAGFAITKAGERMQTLNED